MRMHVDEGYDVICCWVATAGPSEITLAQPRLYQQSSRESERQVLLPLTSSLINCCVLTLSNITAM